MNYSLRTKNKQNEMAGVKRNNRGKKKKGKLSGKQWRKLQKVSSAQPKTKPPLAPPDQRGNAASKCALGP